MHLIVECDCTIVTLSRHLLFSFSCQNITDLMKRPGLFCGIIIIKQVGEPWTGGVRVCLYHYWAQRSAVLPLVRSTCCRILYKYKCLQDWKNPMLVVTTKSECTVGVECTPPCTPRQPQSAWIPLHSTEVPFPLGNG